MTNIQNTHIQSMVKKVVNFKTENTKSYDCVFLRVRAM
jgi:hypothetical protein